jgi:hypothetical protein
MRSELAFTPRYTAEETLREFAGHMRTRPFRPEKADLAYDAERLHDTIERRGRTRDHPSEETHEEAESHE